VVTLNLALVMDETDAARVLQAVGVQICCQIAREIGGTMSDKSRGRCLSAT